MPKTKIVQDVPIWNALVAEYGDPRPYAPTVIDPVTITDEPCVDDVGFDDQYTMLDDAVRYINELLDGLETEARTGFDVVYPLPESTEPLVERRDPALLALLDQTVVLPALTGERTVQLDRKEEPPCPS